MNSTILNPEAAGRVVNGLQPKYIDVRELGFQPNTGVFVDEIMIAIRNIYHWPIDPRPLLIYLPKGIWHGTLRPNRSDITFVGDGADQTIIRATRPSPIGNTVVIPAGNTGTMHQLDIPKDNTPGSLWSLMRKGLFGYSTVGGWPGATAQNRVTPQGALTPYAVHKLFIVRTDLSQVQAVAVSADADPEYFWTLDVYAREGWHFLSDGTFRLFVVKPHRVLSTDLSITPGTFSLGISDDNGYWTGGIGKHTDNPLGSTIEQEYVENFARLDLSSAVRNAQKIKLLDANSHTKFKKGNVVWLNGGTTNNDPMQGNAAIIEHVDAAQNSVLLDRPIHMDYDPNGPHACAMNTNTANVVLPNDGSVVNLVMSSSVHGGAAEFYTVGLYYSVGNAVVKIEPGATNIAGVTTVPVTNPAFLRTQQAGMSLHNQRIARARGIMNGTNHRAWRNLMIAFGLDPDNRFFIYQQRMMKNQIIKGIGFEYFMVGIMTNSCVNITAEDCAFHSNFLDLGFILRASGNASVFGNVCAGFYALRCLWTSPHAVQVQQTDSGGGFYLYKQCTFLNNPIGGSEFNYNVRYEDCSIFMDGNVGWFPVRVSQNAERQNILDVSAGYFGYSNSDVEFVGCQFRVANVRHAFSWADIQWAGPLVGRFNGYNSWISNCRISATNVHNIFASYTGGMNVIENNFIDCDRVFSVCSSHVGGVLYDHTAQNNQPQTHLTSTFTNNKITGDFSVLHLNPRRSNISNNQYHFVPKSSGAWIPTHLDGTADGPLIILIQSFEGIDARAAEGINMVDELYDNFCFTESLFGGMHTLGLRSIDTTIGGGKFARLTFRNSRAFERAAAGGRTLHELVGYNQNVYIEDLRDLLLWHTRQEKALTHVRKPPTAFIEAEMLLGDWLNRIRFHGGTCTDEEIAGTFDALLALCGQYEALGYPRVIDYVIRMNLQFGDAIASRVPLLGYWWDASTDGGQLDLLAGSMNETHYSPDTGWILDHGRHMIFMRPSGYYFGHTTQNAGFRGHHFGAKHSGTMGILSTHLGFGLIACSRREGVQIDAMPPPEYQQSLERRILSAFRSNAIHVGQGGAILGDPASGSSVCGWSSRVDSVSRIHTFPPGVYGMGMIPGDAFHYSEILPTGDQTWQYYFRNLNAQPSASTTTWTAQQLQCAYTNLGKVVATGAHSTQVDGTTVVRRTEGFTSPNTPWTAGIRCLPPQLSTANALEASSAWRGGGARIFWTSPRVQDIGRFASTGAGLGGYCLHHWPRISWLTNTSSFDTPSQSIARTFNLAFVVANQHLGRFLNCNI